MAKGVKDGMGWERGYAQEEGGWEEGKKMRKEWTASYGPANWPIARPLKSVFRGGSER